MLFLLALTAAAATPIVTSDAIVADAGHPLGYGAPSATLAGGTYTVFVEAELPPPAGCSEAWEIVSFTTTNGTTYSGPSAVAGVGAATPCGVRSPGAVWLDSGAHVVAFEDVSTGYVGSLSGGVVSVSTLSGVTEPSLVRYGTSPVWYLFAIRDSDAAMVQYSSTDLATWTFVRTLVTPAQIVSVALYTPSWSCIDGSAVWPFEGAQAKEKTTTSAWMDGTIRSNGNLYIGADRDSWANSSAAKWLSLDLVKSGSNRAVWFETLDASGNSRVGHALIGSLPTSAPGRDCRP